MVNIIVLRDSVSLALALWATHAVFTEDVASMNFLLYPFTIFLLLDFYLQTKIDFILHHVIGVVLCLYCICVPIPEDILTMGLYTETSTIFLNALIYSPKAYVPIVKLIFVCSFYVTRIEYYVEKMLNYDAYNLPYYWVLITCVSAGLSLNLYWFSEILKKASPAGRVGILIFAAVSFVVRYCL
jgi:hypothetical protein